jgi:tight adherence protein B
MSAWVAAACLVGVALLIGRPGAGARIAQWSPPPGQGLAAPEVEVAPTTGTASAAAYLLAATVAGAGAAAARASPIVIVGSVLAVGMIGRVRRRVATRLVHDQCRSATAEVTVAIAAELRAGRTPAEALAAVASLPGPLQAALRAACAAVEVGADPAAELRRAGLLPGADRLRHVAAAWSVAETVGGRVAVVLERLGESMDSEDALRRELDAELAGPRATMVLLAALPVLGLAMGQAIGARPFTLLLHRPLGWGLVATAVVLDALGVVATRAIVRAALRE